jgi:hypothetical protein
MVDAPSTLKTSEDMAALAKLDEEGPANEAKPKALKLSELTAKENVLQPRTSSLMVAHRRSKDHVKTLAEAVKRTGQPLDPIIVGSFGKHWVVLDGHHRLEAYKAVKWKKPVPVTVANLKRRGMDRVREAMVLSAKANIKDKLAMSAHDKLDNGWRLTVLNPTLSKSEVAEITTLSPSTVGTMRAAKRALSEALSDEELAGMPWWIARDRWKGNQRKDSKEDHWQAREEAIRRICIHLGKVQQQVDPWDLARALERLYPHLLDELDDALGTLRGRIKTEF